MSGNIQSLAPKVLTRQTSEEEKESEVKRYHTNEKEKHQPARTATKTSETKFECNRVVKERVEDDRSGSSGNIQSSAPKVLKRQTSEEEEENDVEQVHIDENENVHLAKASSETGQSLGEAKCENDGETEESKNVQSNISGITPSSAPQDATRQNTKEEKESVEQGDHEDKSEKSSVSRTTSETNKVCDVGKLKSDEESKRSDEDDVKENIKGENISEKEVDISGKTPESEVHHPVGRASQSARRSTDAPPHRSDDSHSQPAEESVTDRRTGNVIEQEGSSEGALVTKIQAWLMELKEMESFSTPDALKILRGIADHYWQNPGMRGDIACAVDAVGGADILLTILRSLTREGLFKKNSIWYPANYCYNLIWNLSDESGELAASLGQCGVISLCAANVAHKPYLDHLTKKNVLFLIKASLSILHNLSKIPSNRRQFRESRLVKKLLPYTTTDNKYLKALCMLILANIVDEDQESLLDEKGTIEFLVQLLKEAQESEDRRAQGLSCTELANGLGRLAVNDANKVKIQSANGLPPFINMLDSTDICEQEAATQALWSLSFNYSISQLLSTNEKALNSLRSLQTCGNKAVELSAKGTMWMLRQVRKSLEDESHVDGKKQVRPKSARQSSLRRIHVMISYQWNSQKMVLKIRDALVAAGYVVWVDVDRMCGSTLQAMAEAVEKAAAVIICMSEGYKVSPNCRTEAEYAYQLQKWIIPLMMDMYYEPDGWLGLILGAKYYMDFSGVSSFNDSIQKLIRELDSSKSSFDAPDSVFEEESVEPIITKSCDMGLQSSSPGTFDWTEGDVRSWLADHNLEKYQDSFQECNGRLLHRMKALRQEAPEFFYRSLKEDLGISNLFDILRFTEALEGIR